jgi:F420-dependent oxidoreductase-like protein
MKIGIGAPYWPWAKLDEQIALGKLADSVGLHSFWVAETWGQEAVALLGHLSCCTGQIQLGAGILQIPARQPTTAAMAAATLDAMSGGRLLLGLGLSGPQVSEGWYGEPFTAPLTRTREFVEILRIALSGKTIDYHGKHFAIPIRDCGMGLGKPLKLLLPPVRRQVPVYLGVLGPQTVEQAGAIADGWIPSFFAPDCAADLLAPLYRGLEKSGRSRSMVDVAPVVPAAIADDIDVARSSVRAFLAFYLGAMGARGKNFYVDMADRLGHGDAARDCQDRYLSGDRRGAGNALPDKLIDTFAIAATPATIENRLARFAEVGADTLILVPFGDRDRLLNTVCAYV